MSNTAAAADKVEKAALGMFYRPTCVRRFETGGVEFLIGHAAGENCHGLIGTEHNGIFLACLTDRRIVFTEYGGADWGTPEKQYGGEISRIAGMGEKQLEDFIINRGGYNPWADRRKRKTAKKKDLNRRKRYSVGSFTDGRWQSASDKRTCVHDLEKLIVARMFGGSAHARSRFSHKLYDLLSGNYGHIAHYNKEGFYSAQLEDGPAFMANLRMIASGRTTYGMRPILDDDQLRAMADVAGAYLNCEPID